MIQCQLGTPAWVNQAQPRDRQGAETQRCSSKSRVGAARGPALTQLGASHRHRGAVPGSNFAANQWHRCTTHVHVAIHAHTSAHCQPRTHSCRAPEKPCVTPLTCRDCLVWSRYEEACSLTSLNDLSGRLKGSGRKAGPLRASNGCNCPLSTLD